MKPRCESGVRAKVDVRGQCETLVQCPFPGCEMGQVRTEQDDGHRYTITWDTCVLCNGAGCIAKWAYREYLMRTGTG